GRGLRGLDGSLGDAGLPAHLRRLAGADTGAGWTGRGAAGARDGRGPGRGRGAGRGVETETGGRVVAAYLGRRRLFRGGRVMLLAIEQGNTNTLFAVHDGTEWVAQWRTATHANRTADEYAV